MFVCKISSCDMLQVGIFVNFIMLAVGLAVISLIRISTERTRSRKIDGVLSEFRGAVSHSGYSGYIVAGSAFLGNLPFGNWLTPKHVIFLLCWVIGLLLLLLLEFIKSSLTNTNSELTLSRILAIPTALFFIWWTAIGAAWPW